MQYSEDVLLFKKVIEEMGFVWDDTPGEISVNGIPATEYYSQRGLFDFGQVSYNKTVKITSNVIPQCILPQSCDFEPNDNWLNAA